MLQPFLQTRVAAERNSVRVVHAKQEPVPETAVQGYLHGVIQVVEVGRVLVDRSQPTIRPQQVVDCIRARNRARLRGVLVFLPVRGADVHRVLVDG